MTKDELDAIRARIDSDGDSILARIQVRTDRRALLAHVDALEKRLAVADAILRDCIEPVRLIAIGGARTRADLEKAEWTLERLQAWRKRPADSAPAERPMTGDERDMVERALAASQTEVPDSAPVDCGCPGDVCLLRPGCRVVMRATTTVEEVQK